MSQSPLVLFDTAVQTISPFEIDWDDPNNLLIDSGALYAIAITDGQQPGDFTETIDLNGNNLVGLVPPSSTILELSVAGIAYYVAQDATGGDDKFYYKITAGGTEYDFNINRSNPLPFTITKTLAEWGITQQEARDYVDGNESAFIRCQRKAFFSTSIRVDFVKTQAEYTDSGILSPPRLF